MNRRRAVVLLIAFGIIGYWGWDYWREHRFDKIIKIAGQRYGVEPALVKAIIWRESRFDPDVRGRAGEIGLMQIREIAAMEWADSEHIRSFEHEACFDPRTNILAGTWYLKKVSRRYGKADDPAPYALADYNAGRGNVLKWLAGPAATNSSAFIEQIGFPGTKAYVLGILNRRERYR